MLFFSNINLTGVKWPSFNTIYKINNLSTFYFEKFSKNKHKAILQVKNKLRKMSEIMLRNH